MTQVKTVDKTEQEKIEALAKHLDCSIDEAVNSMDDYLVYTDDEADEAVYNYIDESVCFFRSDFIAAHAEVDEEVIKKLQELHENSNKAIRSLIKDFDHFVNDAVACDGRGHFLASYDHEENEQTINGNDYYIYRSN
jgi:rRNA-processing protein FCF1